MMQQDFICHKFGSLRNRIVPTESGRIGDVDDRGVMATGIYTDALRIKLERLLLHNITSKSTLVFISEPITTRDVLAYCVGLYVIQDTMTDYKKFITVAIKDEYFVNVVKYLMTKKYKKQRLWQVDPEVFNKNRAYWEKIGFRDFKWTNAEILLKIDKECNVCYDNTITLLNNDSGKGYCSMDCYDEKKKLINSHYY